MGFYTNPWGPASGTLLVGDTTYNAMGLTGSTAPIGATDSFNSFGTVSAIGGIASAVGGIFSAMSQKAVLKYQAEAMDLNAAHVRVMSGINSRLTELGAQSALLQGQQQVAALTLKTRQLKGSQRAAMAANGIDLGVGSAAETVASTDLMKEIDKNVLEANAVRSAWGYRTQGTMAAIGAQQQATNYEINALGARTTANGISPAMSGAASLLTSAARVSDAWYRYKKVN